jgi:lactoylglutathione lyase
VRKIGEVLQGKSSSIRVCRRTKGGEKAVIRDVSLTRVFVNDQQAALEFYTEKLGLQKIQDEPYGEGTRWITVSPVGAKIRILLEKAQQDHEKAQVGRSDEGPVMVLRTDDVRAAYEELQNRGVTFTGEPERSPWGIGVVLLDQDGTPIYLLQEPEEHQ